MIVSELSGGMGNQMFQVATAASLAIDHRVEFVLSTAMLNDRTAKDHFTYRQFALSPFGLDRYVSDNPFQSALPGDRDSLMKRIRRKLGNISTYYENSLRYDASLKQIGKNAYLNGYFQSEKYFVHNAESIRELFTLTQTLSEEITDAKNRIKNERTLAIHVRRGDYVKDPGINSVHGSKGVEYYDAAFDFVRQKTSPERILFFSDDPDWVRENLLHRYPVEASISENRTGIEDFELMRTCDSFVIANSSYSWWGAWLGEKPDGVIIAPDRWFNDVKKDSTDIIPERWIRL